MLSAPSDSVHPKRPPSLAISWDTCAPGPAGATTQLHPAGASAGASCLLQRALACVLPCRLPSASACRPANLQRPCQPTCLQGEGLIGGVLRLQAPDGARLQAHCALLACVPLCGESGPAGLGSAGALSLSRAGSSTSVISERSAGTLSQRRPSRRLTQAAVSAIAALCRSGPLRASPAAQMRAVDGSQRLAALPGWVSRWRTLHAAAGEDLRAWAALSPRACRWSRLAGSQVPQSSPQGGQVPGPCKQLCSAECALSQGVPQSADWPRACTQPLLLALCQEEASCTSVSAKQAGPALPQVAFRAQTVPERVSHTMSHRANARRVQGRAGLRTGAACACAQPQPSRSGRPPTGSLASASWSRRTRGGLWRWPRGSSSRSSTPRAPRCAVWSHRT